MTLQCLEGNDHPLELRRSGLALCDNTCLPRPSAHDSWVGVVEEEGDFERISVHRKMNWCEEGVGAVIKVIRRLLDVIQT